MKKLILLIVLFNTCLLFSQHVTNVAFSQRTDGSLKVDITYDLVASEAAVITVQASADGGVTWDLTCASLTGHVGAGVTEGTGKSIEWDFHTDNPDQSGTNYVVKVTAAIRGTMTGNDGTVYQTIKIGNQWWMAENLKETKYRNQSDIPVVTDNSTWRYLSTGARCSYNNDESNGTTYGYLYNWFAAVDTKNIAPSGWRVPSDADWTALTDYLIANGYNWDGTTTGNKTGKSLAATSGWQSSGVAGHVGNDQSTNNTSGFSALPAGLRLYFGSSNALGSYANFWSATELSGTSAWYRYLYYAKSDVSRYDNNMNYGLSIRLIQGESAQPALTHITITPAEATIQNGETQQFTCMAFYTDESSEDVTSLADWSVTPGTAGNIDASGLFTAYQGGTETITASYRGMTAEAEVIIPLSVSISPVATRLCNNVSKQFVCTAQYSDGSNEQVSTGVSWSTSPGTAGSINTNGVFTVHIENTGIETITATYEGETAQAIVTISLFETGTMTGNDGTVYKTVKIGNQWWMAENLRETMFRSGNAIPEAADEWLATSARCSYNNDESNADTYGYLYNGSVVFNPFNVAPNGWRVPSHTDWTNLTNYLINNGYNWDGTTTGNKIGKSLAATSGWQSNGIEGNIGNDQSTNNTSGFTVLPAGYRDIYSTFNGLGYLTTFWTSQGAATFTVWVHGMSFNLPNLGESSTRLDSGYSIRLIME